MDISISWIFSIYLWTVTVQRQTWFLMSLPSYEKGHTWNLLEGRRKNPNHFSARLISFWKSRLNAHSEDDWNICLSGRCWKGIIFTLIFRWEMVLESWKITKRKHQCPQIKLYCVEVLHNLHLFRDFAGDSRNAEHHLTYTFKLNSNFHLKKSLKIKVTSYIGKEISRDE